MRPGDDLGSLYGAIAGSNRVASSRALEAEDRRNPYRLTAIGPKALRARLTSMQAVAKVGQRRLANA